MNSENESRDFSDFDLLNSEIRKNSNAQIVGLRRFTEIDTKPKAAAHSPQTLAIGSVIQEPTSSTRKIEPFKNVMVRRNLSKSTVKSSLSMRQRY